MLAMAQQEGTCFCGCGEKTDKVWFPGHDSIALHGLLHMRYHDTRGFLEAHGYGPLGKNLHEELERQRNEDKNKQR
jgi:hypothetical protein